MRIESTEAQLDFFESGGFEPQRDDVAATPLPPIVPVAVADAPHVEVEPRPVTAVLSSDEDVPPIRTEVIFVRNLRAKNYRLTLRRDGVPIATIPARGTEKAARKFVKENADWLRRMQDRHQKQPRMADRWMVGTTLMWRGEMVEIKRANSGERPQVILGAEVFRVNDLANPDLRPTLEAAFKSRARIELTARTWELAAETGMDVKKVSVRNQRTRWGSCTEGGVISLNWRLILSPPFVSDYVIFHELMHLREMNHSKRFWAAVAEVCPDWEEAEVWLDKHGSYLGL